jgi:hypothetical protein
MNSRAVVSREYKVMLKADKFAGTPKQQLGNARRLWTDFLHSVESIVLETEGTLDKLGKQRLIVFLDSAGEHLRTGGYIFRVRRTLDGGQPEITLKFRHPDRYVAEGRQMKCPRLRTKTKFEEDIKAPFISLYSLSTRGRIGKKGIPSSLDDVSRLFPDLSKRLRKADGAAALSEVNAFTARELVITGPLLRIGMTPTIYLECALIVWYDHKGAENQPVAVEFSYRYGNAAGEYGGKVARRAFDIFAAMQTGMTEWLDPNPRTKTAFVYG